MAQRSRVAVRIRIHRAQHHKHDDRSSELERALHGIAAEMHAWLAKSPRHAAMLLTDPVAAIQQVAPELARRHRDELARLRSGSQRPHADVVGLDLASVDVEVVP